MVVLLLLLGHLLFFLRLELFDLSRLMLQVIAYIFGARRCVYCIGLLRLFFRVFVVLLLFVGAGGRLIGRRRVASARGWGNVCIVGRIAAAVAASTSLFALLVGGLLGGAVIGVR